MKAFTFLMHAAAATLLLTAAGCERGRSHGGPPPGPSGVIPTKFPGEVSAGGKLGPLAQAAPVRSEKAGTATPRKDVKPAPSKALPPGTPPSSGTSK
jgi:hypothetical protein